jgi:hypothetical protein
MATLPANLAPQGRHRRPIFPGMPKVKLAKVAKGEKRAIFAPTFEGPAFKDTGDLDCTCPTCGWLLAKGLYPRTIFDMAVLCPSCNEVSRFPKVPKGSELHGRYGTFQTFPQGTYKIYEPVLVRRIFHFGPDAKGKLPKVTEDPPIY